MPIMKTSPLLGATALLSSLAFLPGVAMAQDAGAQTSQNDPAQACARDPNAPGCQNTPASTDQSGGTGNPDASPETQAAQGGSEVLVTGSRIARPNLDAAVPITAITAADLTDTGNVSLGDELNQLPALRATFSQANSTRAIGTAGLNILDLRGLGTDRTLVLVNGRRHVSAVPGSFNIDVNTIPNALLESVEIVTGGTSAVYGSDAIAGVVNFKLKRDFDGVEIRAQGGVSDNNDRGTYLVSGVFGKNFAGGRGNIAVAGEFASSRSVLFSDRNSQTGAYTGVPGFYTTQATSRLINGVLTPEPNNYDGIPDTTYFSAFPGGTFGNLSLTGGVQATCPTIPAAATPAQLALIQARRAANCTGTFSPTTGAEYALNYYFNQDGTQLLRDNGAIDLRPTGGGFFGGASATGVEGAMLLPGLNRANFNVLVNYEFSPAFRVFAEGKYTHVINNQTSTQPTFINSTLSPTFQLDNGFLTEGVRSTIRTIQGLAPTATTGTFTLFRFNNDIGTRAENHVRDTYRAVLGVRGDISTSGNLNYEVAATYGRTDTYYETGGNVNIVNFNRALDAVVAPAAFTGQNFVTNSAGQRVICRANAGAAGNAFPDCFPLNVFGQYQSDARARNYVLYTSSRNQWAEQIDAVAYIAGDSSFLFSLPAGPIGFSVGTEFRREDAYSDYDDFTQAGNTFLNSFATFNPPAVNLYEGFGELRIPILKDMFFHDLYLEGAARYSKYSTADDGVWAYNVGAVFAPIRDIRFRVGYARSVRAPNLSDLFATATQTFVNGFVDPCNQGTTINANPNRVRNCAAAGVPTTLTYTDDSGNTRTIPWQNAPSSGIVGINSGNLNLTPEVGKSLTMGFVFEPSFLRGFALTLDYYKIRVENVISGLNGQTIINQCYDDPVGLDNPYCAAISRRTSGNAVVNGTFAGQGNRVLAGVANNARDFVGVPTGNSFVNQPFNYALFKTSGIDADLSYNHTFPGGVRISYRGLVSWLENRETFTFITAPAQSNRINGLLGDPEWRGRFSANISYQGLDFGYDVNYIGKMAVAASWETQFTHQGRGPTNLDAFPISMYAPQLTHDLQVGYRVNRQFRAFAGVDNFMDTIPPYGLTGTGAGSGIYGVIGRYMYAGVNVRF
jgi:outer membrane receptor protein involved in Fe transport